MIPQARIMCDSIKEIAKNNSTIWVDHYHIGRGWSFTKKGPGRSHNHVGSEIRFKKMHFDQEYEVRRRIGRFSKTFKNRLNRELNTDKNHKPRIISQFLKMFLKMFPKMRRS
jgi:hypothetical protein